jgi:hypothetical protein
MRPSHIEAILASEFRAAAEGVHTPVMLWGAPGVGKSRIVQEVARASGVPLVDLRLAQMEPTDLRGIPFRDGARVVWSIPAMLPDAERHGARGILFLDEISSAPPTVTAAAYQLILDRRLGEYRAPEGWAIFAAGNRHGDRGVTYSMPAPLANRFTHYELEPHLDDWVAWAHREGIDERLIGFLRFRPELLLDFDAARHRAAFPSPRSWEFAHRALAKFGARPELLADALAACVGEAAALALRAYLDHLGRLPDIAAIAAGKSSEIPQGIDLQYAVAAALVRRVVRLGRGAPRRAACENALAYAARLPHRELGVMLVADLARALDEPLYDVPGFDAWASAVSDLVCPERRIA